MKLSSVISLFALLFLSGCTVDPTYPTRSKDLYKYGSITGQQGFLLNQPSEKTDASSTEVNRYLWHGALKTLSFAPLASCDVKSGVILTEWYQIEGIPSESYKTTVHIKSKELRADALDVHIHKRIRSGNGAMATVPVAPEIVEKMENAILYQAKLMRQKEKN